MKKNCIKTLKTLVSKGICTHGGGGLYDKAVNSLYLLISSAPVLINSGSSR